MIGYDRELPRSLEPIVARETAPPITREDLVQFFEQFFREKLKVVADFLRVSSENPYDKGGHRHLVINQKV